MLNPAVAAVFMSLSTVIVSINAVLLNYNYMIHLPIDLENFGFVQREKHNNVAIIYKCNRDFLYYALHYFFPSSFNHDINNPKEIDRKGLFGIALPSFLAWTLLPVYKTPKYLLKHSLNLRINKKEIHNYFQLMYGILCSRISYDEAIFIVEKDIREHNVAAIDIAFRFQGLEDHILFVYGFDEENFYVFDTHKVPGLQYEKLTSDERFYMKISKAEIKKRWKRFSRVWEVSRILNKKL